MESDGANVRQLTTKGENVHPAWSPSSEHILFTSHGDNEWDSADIMIMDVDGENKRQIYSSKYTDTHAQMSPDGSMIAYTESRYTDTRYDDLVIITLDGRELARFTDGVATYWGSRHVWSPDSKRLAVVKDHEDQRADTIQVIDLENDFARRDVITLGFTTSIDWLDLPNQNVLLFSAEEPNSAVFRHNGSSSLLIYDTEIYAFDLDTNVLTQITYTNQRESSVDWSP